MALVALAGSLVALWHTHRAVRRLRGARLLAEQWREQAAFRREHGEEEAAGWLEYSSYWLLKELAGRG